jgi:hypothetical protein
MRWRKSPPSPQLGLLPPLPPLGETLKREGIETVLAHNPGWHDAALSWIIELPGGREFTGEDMVAAVGEPPNKYISGATISGASQGGLIFRTAQWRKAADAKKHAHLNPVWRRAA